MVLEKQKVPFACSILFGTQNFLLLSKVEIKYGYSKILFELAHLKTKISWVLCLYFSKNCNPTCCKVSFLVYDRQDMMKVLFPF